MIYINLSKCFCIYLKRMNDYGENIAKNIRRLNDMIDQKKVLYSMSLKNLEFLKKINYTKYMLFTRDHRK